MNYERINFKNGQLVSPGSVDLETGELTMPVYTGETPINDVNLNKMDEAIKYLFENGCGGGGGDNTPIGTIFAYGGATAPNGYLLANGQEVSRNEYVDLFNVYGTIYGVGDGSTTFNVPDYRDKIPVGLNVNTSYFNSLGKTGGEATHTLTINEMPTHSHNAKTYGSDSISTTAYNGSYYQAYEKANLVNWESAGTTEVGGSQPHNNLQPYIVQNYIIKATKVTPTTAEVEDSLESNSTTNAPSIHAVNNALNGIVLYENASGTSETVALSDSLENYRKIDVEFRITDGNIYETKTIYSPHNKKWSYSRCETDLENNNWHLFRNEYTNSDYTIVCTHGGLYQGHTNALIHYNNTKITKVIGYK